MLPVLVDRYIPDDLPGPLRFLADCRAERIGHQTGAAELYRVIDHILATVPGSVPATGASISGATVTLGDDLVWWATLAVLRHQLPQPQRRMRNDAMLSAVVADQFDQLASLSEPTGLEQLQFAAVGRSPNQPRGSGVVMVTDRKLRMIDVEPNLRAGRVVERPLHSGLAPAALDVALTPCHRAWLATADVRISAPGHEDLDALGMFRPAAELLVESLTPNSRSAGNQAKYRMGDSKC